MAGPFGAISANVSMQAAGSQLSSVVEWAGASAPAHPVSGQITMQSILVVDDEPDVADLFRQQCYINGKWVPSAGEDSLEVTNSATEEVIATIPDGSTADVDAAVAAAKAACGTAHLKTILEVGELGGFDAIRRASMLAMARSPKKASSDDAR